MRRAVPPKIKFVYLGLPESQKRLDLAYSRIFLIAKQNILERKRVEKVNGAGKESVIKVHYLTPEVQLCTLKYSLWINMRSF